MIQTLNKIQTIKDKRIKNFKNKTYIIPKYDKEVLIKETNLFCDWYLKKIFQKKIELNLQKNLKK